LQEIIQTEKLGEGDCGVIYKARWRGIDAALKTLKGSIDYAPDQSSLSESAARADLINEIEMLSCLRHPNVSLAPRPPLALTSRRHHPPDARAGATNSLFCFWGHASTSMGA
jgi:hypothetical protein